MPSTRSSTRRSPTLCAQPKAAEILTHTATGAGLAAALVLLAAPLVAQDRAKEEQVWRMGNLRSGFCVLLFVDPQIASRNIPEGLKLVQAGQASDLHPALKSEIQAQPSLGAWSPSRLCFYSMDTVQTNDYTLTDRKRRNSPLFALWTVSAIEAASGSKRDVALLLLSNNERLIRSAKLAGQYIRAIEAMVGKVPEVDMNGVPSRDDRFQVKIGKTLVTWDGHQATDSAQTGDSLKIAWITNASERGKGSGTLTLTPQWASPMAGSLKVEGKDDLAKALKGSPVRFVGPMYRGGGGEVYFGR
jgi:hypothetical protein